MMIFSGRPLWTSIILAMLLAARGFAQDPEAQQQPPPPPTDGSTAPAKPVASPADSDATKADKTKADQNQTKPENAAADMSLPPDKRVLGVLPNYRTVNETGVYVPIDTKHKLIIAMKDSFDYPLVLLSAGFAGISQLDNSNQSYHQGLEGYAKRLGANYASQAIGNMMTEGFYPALLHEDPRYRRIGPERGHVGYRTWYAFSRIFVTRTDSGGTRFNFSEWGGNATGVAISNLYQPDQRDWHDNFYTLLEQCATDGVSQILKEFWPDIKQKFFHRKPLPGTSSSASSN